MSTTSSAEEAGEFPDGTETLRPRTTPWGAEPAENSAEFTEYSNSFVSEPWLDASGLPSCGLWQWPVDPKNGDGTRHASFGDNGTTASISRGGDIMQVSQFLGCGNSGVFSMDHARTGEPYYVHSRAADLEALADTTYYGPGYTYGPAMTEWPSRDPDTVRWVHWRWPRYEWEPLENEDLKIIFQYYVREGVVLHQLLFHNKSKKAVQLDYLELKDAMHIRDLDYVSHQRSIVGTPAIAGPSGYGFVQTRGATSKTSGMEPPLIAGVIDVFVDGIRTKIGPGGRHPFRPLMGDCTTEIVIAHRLSIVPDQPRAEGQLPSRCWQDFMIPAAQANVGKFLRDEVMEGSSTCLGIMHLPLSECMAQDEAQIQMQNAGMITEPIGFEKQPESRIRPGNASGQTTARPEERQNNTELQKIRYFRARHLEHILSVCAMPTSGPEKQPEKAPVALTCGDMSGHRICTSASFYAFQFLVEIERQLSQQVERGETRHIDHIASLRTRIKDVCERHILWLKNVWETSNPGRQPFDSGHFVANYWIGGGAVPSGDGTFGTWQPPDYVTDTAFQILKITQYANTYHRTDEGKMPDSFEALLNKVFVAWLGDLDSLDRRNQFAWPHSKEDGVDVFRLSDHYWLWLALKAMESRAMWTDLPGATTSNARKGRTDQAVRQKSFQRRIGWPESFTPPASFNALDKAATLERDRQLSRKKKLDEEWKDLYAKFFWKASRLAPSEVQRGVLQRFTIVNDVSGVRMLAVSRSSRDSRFLLHDDDSTMFHSFVGPLGSFFPDKSFESLWEETIKCQLHHPANDAVFGYGWYNVMRYALSIVMGARGQTLNTTNAQVALEDSLKTLVSFFSHNSFVGDQLSEIARTPILFNDESDRDSYFHAGFEVMYTLITHAHRIHPKTEENRPSTRTYVAPDPMAEIIRHLADISSTLRSQKGAHGVTHHGKAIGIMEERLPFNNHIGSGNVVSIEEEWLYNYPQFLSTPTVELSAIDPRLHSRLSSSSVEGSRARAVRAVLCDMPKRKQYGKARKNGLNVVSYGLTNHELWTKLGATARRAQDAKKRFILLLPTANDVTRELCVAATASEEEKQAVDVFFRRHHERDKYVDDDTSLPLNVWNSEFHLSFNCLPALNSIGTANSSKTPLGTLRRASMSFRFQGDLFDRYWTCHFIASLQLQAEDEKDASGFNGSVLDQLMNNIKFYEREWWQRTVLELALLRCILDTVFKNTQTILDNMEQNIHLSPNREQGKASSTDTLRLGSECMKRLDDMQEDLISTLETLQNWDDRGKGRGEQRPRWTLKDETKYRRHIQKAQASISSRRSEIRKQKERAQNLFKRFQEKQTSIKEEKERQRVARSEHSDRNIRWFTYVTIVFAPLSFAEGFYSMGGAPSGELVKSLAIYCVAALSITICLIFGAIKVFSVMRKERDFLETARGEARDMSLTDWWSLLVTTILDHLVRTIRYPMRISERRAQSVKILPAIVLGAVLAVIVSPLFIAVWSMQFCLLTLHDGYRLLKRGLYFPAEDPSKRARGAEEEAGKPREHLQRGSFATNPPRILESFVDDFL